MLLVIHRIQNPDHQIIKTALKLTESTSIPSYRLFYAALGNIWTSTIVIPVIYCRSSNYNILPLFANRQTAAFTIILTVRYICSPHSYTTNRTTRREGYLISCTFSSSWVAEPISRMQEFTEIRSLPVHSQQSVESCFPDDSCTFRWIIRNGRICHSRRQLSPSQCLPARI